MKVTQREVLIRLVHDLARQINDASCMLEAECGLTVTYEDVKSSSGCEILQPRFTRASLPAITHGLHSEVSTPKTFPGGAT